MSLLTLVQVSRAIAAGESNRFREPSFPMEGIEDSKQAELRNVLSAARNSDASLEEFFSIVDSLSNGIKTDPNCMKIIASSLIMQRPDCQQLIASGSPIESNRVESDRPGEEANPGEKIPTTSGRAK